MLWKHYKITHKFKEKLRLTGGLILWYNICSVKLSERVDALEKMETL